MKDYLRFKKNIYSQNGEDGILEELLKDLNIKTGICVDIGAWDGKYLSNIYKLILDGWGAVMVEADKRKFMSLVNNHLKNPKVSPILYPVTPDGLDQLFDLYNIQKHIQVINIDIDGPDYYVWANTKKYIFDVVIIESNGKEGEYVSKHYGSSATSLTKLGEELGYVLVANTGNLFFVRKELYDSMLKHLS